MQKRLQIALMATAVATLSLTSYAQAASHASITPATDDTGHKVYVNDVVAPSAARQTFRTQQNHLAFWSTTERRWKTVPHANVKAAQSAAAEVDQYLGKSQSTQNSLSSAGFSQLEVNAAIDKAAARHNVDANLVRALVKVESNFNPNAVSRKGAMGLMQLMPQTARQLKVTNPFDPEQNVDAGVRHLKMLMENYGGDVSLSLAAYNAGAGAVARRAGVPRIPETRDYVRRITQLYYGDARDGRILGSPV